MKTLHVIGQQTITNPVLRVKSNLPTTGDPPVGSYNVQNFAQPQKEKKALSLSAEAASNCA